MKSKKPGKNTEQRILVIISCILTVLIIFSASFFLVFFDRSFYNKSFEKHGVYDELGAVGVRNTIDYLINYLISENTEINKTEELNIFSPEEKSHLEDVHTLIHGVKILSIISLFLLIIIILRLRMLKGLQENIKKMLIYSSIAALVIILLLFLLSINFPAFFESFHKILFPQGNYSFPESYLLIKLFPEAFFKDFARKIFFHAAIISLILLFLSSSSALSFRNTRRH